MCILHNRVINIFFFLLLTFLHRITIKHHQSDPWGICKTRAILNDVLVATKTQQSLSPSIIYGRHARDKTKSKKIINLFVEVIITKHRKTILRLPKIDKTIEVFRILALWLALPYFGSSLCRPGTVLEIQMTNAESEGLWKSMIEGYPIGYSAGVCEGESLLRRPLACS